MPYKLGKRIGQIEASIARYLAATEAADRHDGDGVPQAKSARLKNTGSPDAMRAPRHRWRGALFQVLVRT
ncbi:hypothetical protein [Falsiroseomonas sp. HW251]|uniref:hypothetical protein n=1 Tax=Falsiroseomonas sp. HW251 TaxID=3390998 RepID=UPI003D315085